MWMWLQLRDVVVVVVRGGVVGCIPHSERTPENEECENNEL